MCTSHNNTNAKKNNTDHKTNTNDNMAPETTPNETEFCMECRNELEPRSIKQGWPKTNLERQT